MEPKASEAHPFKTLAYTAWFDVGKIHLSFLYENAVKTWKPPAPGHVLKNEALKKAHFASVLFELFEMVLQSNEPLNFLNALADQKSNRELHDVSLHFIFWRCHLLSMVAQCEGLVPTAATNEQLANFGVEAEDIMHKLWQLIRKVRVCYDHKKLKKQLPDNLTNDKKIKKAVKDFYDGNLEIINKMLQLNCTAKRKNEPLSEILDRWFEKAIAAKVCRWCKKKEDETGSFTMCKECKKDKYPDVNYFCSTSCQDFSVFYMAAIAFILSVVFIFNLLSQHFKVGSCLVGDGTHG
ncbi:hypothetical protein B566_EDAN009575 [Ephemera danica]|nr:hypothetical protein B566_EDAN009575 [Ephemera danica]